MAYSSTRDFVDALDRAGELVRVRRPVDPVLEVATVANRVMKRGGPALLFERVGGSPFPLLINAFGSPRRMAMALSSADLDEPARRLEELLRARPGARLSELAKLAALLPELASVPPRTVRGGPSQDVALTGDEVDLRALPVITSWPKDGGPFLTLPLVVTRDPDTGLRNVGMYRMQVIGPRETFLHWQVHKTGARHFRRARELGLRRMEVAVALGGDPAMTYAATAPLPEGVDEWMLAGFLRREPVRLTRGVTVELEVPADADFVLEGYVDPAEDLGDEGPFGDHTGYYTPVERFPRFHVTALTRRADAIYPTTIVGPPPMEDAWLGKATERLFLPALRLLFPEIVDMNLPIEGAFHNLVIVSVKKQYPFHAARLAHGLWGAGQMMFSKVILVVDEDVDVQRPADVVWRALANLDPKRDLSFVEGPIDQLDHGASQALFGSKVCIDATRKWPEEGYRREWPEVCRTSPEMEARVDGYFHELGLGAGDVRDPAPATRGLLERLVERLGGG